MLSCFTLANRMLRFNVIFFNLVFKITINCNTFSNNVSQIAKSGYSCMTYNNQKRTSKKTLIKYSNKLKLLTLT